jgi:nitrate reductase NapE component
MTAFSLWFGITPPKPEQEKQVFLLLIGLFSLIAALTVGFGFLVLYLMAHR